MSTAFQEPVTAGNLLIRIRGEYREMPGLNLTMEQAMRLWALDRDTCNQALRDLMNEHFVTVDDRGRYMRLQS